MAITLKVHKMLWGRAADRCAYDGCRRQLIEDATETDDESVIGDEAHIVSGRPNGPRADPSFPRDEIDSYGNVILLDKLHHKLVDDQPLTYPRERLLEMKRRHVEWVDAQLSPADRAKERDDELYAEYVDEWVKRADITKWNAWTSGLFSGGQPTLLRKHVERMEALHEWMFTRVWPGRYPKFETAFTNFRVILRDLLNVLAEHSEPAGDYLMTSKFYHIREWNRELYDELAAQYEEHVALVEDLGVELTRAGNYLCDVIRETVDHRFRRSEGMLIFTSGPHMPDGAFRSYRVTYRPQELAGTLPYPGLDKFLEARTSRDFHFGPLQDSK